MPHLCTTCQHKDLDQIDQALLANEPLRRIAARFGLSPSALWRHKRNHLGQGSEECQPGDALACRVDKLEKKVTRLHRSLVELLVILRRQGRV